MGSAQPTATAALTRRSLLGHGAARAAVALAEPPFDPGAFGTVGVYAQPMGGMGRVGPAV